MTRITDPRSGGFSLVEVIVAIFILSVGILAMGVSTGHVMAQIQAAELRTERMNAFRESAEILRSYGWANLDAACSNAGSILGTEHYTVSCSVAQPEQDLRVVTFVASGPGFQAGHFTTTMADTFSISIAR